MASRRKVSIDGLSEALQDILAEYGDSVTENVQEVTHQVGQIGVKTIRAESRSKLKGTGKYARGWRLKSQTDRFGQTEIIHNASLPGLPHLLEHGHAKANGGRTQPIVHIAPVEEELIRTFERDIKIKL